MINCPECNRSVEEQIPACLYCGARIYVEHPADMTIKDPPKEFPPKLTPQSVAQRLSSALSRGSARVSGVIRGLLPISGRAPSSA